MENNIVYHEFDAENINHLDLFGLENPFTP
jgi:hypothetical protein